MSSPKLDNRPDQGKLIYVSIHGHFDSSSALWDKLKVRRIHAMFSLMSPSAIAPT